MAQWSNEVLASNLRLYMERAGKSQKDMADIVGVSAPTFSDWINAKKYPRIDKIEIMADYFGILKSDLIEEKKEKLTADGELTDNIQKLIEFAKTVPEDKAEMILKVMQSIVESD